jgi:hypothetical protein
MRTIHAQAEIALGLGRRKDHIRAKVEDGDGNMVDLGDLLDQDWVDEIQIDCDTDRPIGEARIKAKRIAGPYSLSWLNETSQANKNAAGAYDPILHPMRVVEFEAAVTPQGYVPTSGEWMDLWEGITRKVESDERSVSVTARDPMSRLSTKFMEDITEHGNDDGSVDITEYIQAILDAEFGASVIDLNTVGTPAFPILENPDGGVGHVTVFDALVAARDLIGWNLHWRWVSGLGAFGLVLWEPDRATTTALRTITDDDGLVVHSIETSDEGIRNKVKVVYLDTDGVEQEEEDDNSGGSIYGVRAMPVDARGTSVVTSGQAAALATAIVTDLEVPEIPMVYEIPFFPWVELGDLYEFSANDHFTSATKFAVRGFTHVISAGQARTRLRLSAKPTGGYKRWLAIEIEDPLGPEAGKVLHVSSAERDHTGDTAYTILQTVPVPPLSVPVASAVRVRAVFRTTGSGGTKEVSIAYAGVLAGTGFTMATGAQTLTIDVTFEPFGAAVTGLIALPVQSAPRAASVSVDHDEPQNIDFGVEMVDAGDTAILEFSEVMWLGEAA